MKLKLALMALGALAALGAIETPQAWPQENGDTCYTYFASLSCTAAQQPPVTARPSATATPYSTNTPIPSITPTAIHVYLNNGDFENGLTGWTQFNLNGAAELNSERVSNGADTLAVHSGDGSARLIAHYACYRSGVYQVIGVPVNAHVRVTAWVMTLGSRENGLHAPEPNMNSYVSIGVDPLGLTSAAVSRIEWQRIVGGQLVGAIHGLDPSWQLITLDTIATRPTMTVFVYGDLGKTQDGACMWAYMNLLTFIDDISVEVVP